MMTNSTINFIFGLLLSGGFLLSAVASSGQQLQLSAARDNSPILLKPADPEVKPLNSESATDSFDDQTAAFRQGQAEAQADIRRGKLVIHFGGIAVPNQKFKELMLNNYGVTVITGGCVMTEAEAKRLEGYDEISRAAIEAKFGPGTIEEVREASQKEQHDELWSREEQRP